MLSFTDHKPPTTKHVPTAMTAFMKMFVKHVPTAMTAFMKMFVAREGGGGGGGGSPREAPLPLLFVPCLSDSSMDHITVISLTMHPCTT